MVQMCQLLRLLDTEMGFFFFLDKNVSLYLAIISLCASAKFSAMTVKEKKKNTSKLSTLSSDSFLIHLKFGVYLTQVGGREDRGHERSFQAELPQTTPEPTKKKMKMQAM